MTLVRRIAIAAVSIGLMSAAQAQTWPDKPIRAYIPFGAGSATDVIHRAVFDAVATELGQPIIVENRGGAGGTLAVGAVVRADPDGYTILANSSAHTVSPFIVSTSYDTAKDLSGVLMAGQNANVMIVNSSKGWKTVKDFIAAAKANPGSINYGSAGVGSATHISAERFRMAAGIQAQHVPYKGGPEAITDLLGGRIDFYFCPISTALPLIRDGRVVALVVSIPTRASDLPDVPTPAEAGFANADTIVWYGVFMPSKTPRAIVDKFNAAAVKVLATPAMKAKLKQLAVDPMPMTPAEIDQLVVKELSSNEKLIKAAGVK
ncbi:MAG TPA: tripartite tricarboxylate transporter substrate binding protein [Pseudolabrys sp.]|nr:tripartite tricarboxylate transporter substrate binding protein [Pseudolabrys sp.]